MRAQFRCAFSCVGLEGNRCFDFVNLILAEWGTYVELKGADHVTENHL